MRRRLCGAINCRASLDGVLYSREIWLSWKSYRKISNEKHTPEKSRRRPPLNGFLLHSPAEARWNMAVDNWLAQQAPLARGELIVRLYQWSSGAISVGRNQLWQKALRLPNLKAGQIAVRRITGGRAIFHDESELTYSIVLELGSSASLTDTRKTGQAPTPDTLTIDKPFIVETSLKISSALVVFLRRLKVAARIERGRTGANDRQRSKRSGLTPACFESVTRHEITIGGRKIVAGAQRIIGTRYFQHGSIKLDGIAPHPALCCANPGVNPGVNPSVNLSQSGNKSAPGSCYTLQKVAPCSHSVAQAFKAAFEEVFRSTLPEITLTEADRAAIFDRQARLDCIVGAVVGAVGLPGATKGASLPIACREADLPPLGETPPGLEAGFLTQSTLTEMRRVCDREVDSKVERTLRVAQNHTTTTGGAAGGAVGGTVGLAVRAGSGLSLHEEPLSEAQTA